PDDRIRVNGGLHNVGPAGHVSVAASPADARAAEASDGRPPLRRRRYLPTSDRAAATRIATRSRWSRSPSRSHCPDSSTTARTNSPWLPNGPAVAIRSWNVHPSTRSRSGTPESWSPKTIGSSARCVRTHASSLSWYASVMACRDRLPVPSAASTRSETNPLVAATGGCPAVTVKPPSSCLPTAADCHVSPPSYETHASRSTAPSFPW